MKIHKRLSVGIKPKYQAQDEFHKNGKNLKGRRFGKLKVFCEWGRNSKRSITWLCHCDCGETVIRVGSSLLAWKTSSCGCNLRSANVVAKRALKQTKPKTALRKAYKACQNSAKIRGYEFTLSLEEFETLTAKNCFYCGQEPNQIKKSTHETYLANGIDRKDNKQGYILFNCVPCCVTCNLMKLDMTSNDFFAQCRKIIEMEKTHGTSAK